AAVMIAGGGWLGWKAIHGPPGPANSAAYDDYLKARVKASTENREDNLEAIRYLKKALAADPNYAPAHAELARAYTIRAFYFAPDSDKKTLNEDAQVEVDKALALNPKLGEAWFAKGLNLWTPGRSFPHEQAIAAYRRALEYNSGLDEAHHQLALVLLH